MKTRPRPWGCPLAPVPCRRFFRFISGNSATVGPLEPQGSQDFLTFSAQGKHSDPNVRLEAIKICCVRRDDLPRLMQVARHDRDVRVRRIAVKKIDDPELDRRSRG